MTQHPVERCGRVGVWASPRPPSKIEDGGSKIAIGAEAPRDPRSSILDLQIVSPTPIPPYPHTGEGGIGKVVRLLLVACLLVGLLGGCDADVNAVLGTDRIFTLYGVITPQADTQKVLVYPIEGVLRPAQAEPLDAHFTSTDMQSGERRVWRDSLKREANGQYTHIFWSPFRAEYGHTYRLEVERSDGATSRVDAAVPPFSELVEQETPEGLPVITPILVNGEVPRLLKVEVTYVFRFKDPAAPVAQTKLVVLSYDDKVERVAGGWLIPVNLSQDFLTIRSRLLLQGTFDRAFGIRLTQIILRLIAANEEWNPPDGVFETEVLVQPGTLSNVEDGFGFVGAGYRLERSWLPLPEAIEAAGFTRG